MTVVFFSDPHLGVERKTHSTPESRKALKETLFQHVLKVLREHQGYASIYCLGDLFDNANNPENIILQGMEVVDSVDGVLAGNHDIVSRVDCKTSLQLLSEALPGKVIINEVGEFGHVTRLHTGLSRLYLIPHVATQSLFEASLREAEAEAKAEDSVVSVLCLHCNYDSPHAEDENTLNLTSERAEELLRAFRYILIGHEHIPRRAFEGRLQVLGNTHPTSFSDISDKFVWALDPLNGLSPSLIWSQDEGYLDLPWEALLEGSIEVGDKVQFLEVTGVAPAEKLPEIARGVADLWGRHPQLLLVRNIVECQAIEAPLSPSGPQTLLDLPARIKQELSSDKDLLELWESYEKRG